MVITTQVDWNQLETNITLQLSTISFKVKSSRIRLHVWICSDNQGRI